MDAFTDYYALLGISKDAQPGAIKAAFKKLALQYHPDVYKGEDAHERMRVLLVAYQTLSDPVARKKYDLHYAEHMRMHGALPAPRKKEGGSAGISGTAKNGRAEITPSARRDRQRHYAFPVLRVDQPAYINLVDMAYQLSSEEARTLLGQGMLRGIAPVNGAQGYYCHRCHHHWRIEYREHAAKKALPLVCPQCFAADWPEYLLLRCIHCSAVFESEQIRYAIGAYTYGKSAQAKKGGLCPPYELFPLCPYCGTAHWCPAEEERVDKLRKKATRRASFWRVF